MQTNFTQIVLETIAKKAKQSGFYFVLVCLIGYVAYQKVPLLIEWYIVRQDREVIRYIKELHECDSLGRAQQTATLKELIDCYAYYSQNNQNKLKK